MQIRPSVDNVMIEMARILSLRGTCARRMVGCILTNKYGHIIGSGYNGPARGQNHCIDFPCPGAALGHGQGLDVCEAIHAEQNALLQCKDVNEIATCYTTMSPCRHCVKLLLNTSCETIFYYEEYSDAQRSANLWTRAGRKWVRCE
jgi:dCMP deaminase